MSVESESASLLADLSAGGDDLMPAVRQSRGFIEPEQEPAPAPVVAQTAEPAEPEPTAAALPALGDGAATCAERLELLGMLLASPCPSSTITAPPERLQLPLPADGFMCDQCGDRFVLPGSLAQHQQRRSMRVTLNCPMCQALVVFDNKCQLLEHLDAHKIDPVSIDPALIDASALTAAELGIVPPTPAATAAPVPASASPGAAKRPVKAQGVNKIVRPSPMSCPMCNQLCSTLTLGEHLCPEPEDELTPLPAPPPRCPDCQQPCATECSMMAHQGLHKPDLWPYPYVCPECGVKILGTHDQALQHVVAGCLHMTRDVKICCSICREELEDAKTHMVQAHVQKLYKCRRCPLAFESANGFNSHLLEKHGGVLIAGESPFMSILKCPFCAATFNNANALKEHMGSRKHGERVLQQVSFVFRCPECELDFSVKSELAKHLAKQHPDFKPVSMILPLRSTEPPPPPPPSRLMGRPRNTSDTPTRSQRGPVVYACGICHTDFKRKPDYTEHARMHLRDGVPICLLCNTRFGTMQMLKNHLNDHASEPGRDRCGLCYAKLNTVASLQYHLEGEHGMRTFDCVRCSMSFERLTDLNRHNFSVHRSSGRGVRRTGANQPVPTPAALAQTAAATRSPALSVKRAPPVKDEMPAKRRRAPAVQDEPEMHLQLEEEEVDEPQPRTDGETLEEIANFVAAGDGERSAQFVVEEEPVAGETEEVIELELNEGEITAKQVDAFGAETALPATEEAEYIMPDLDGAGTPHRPSETEEMLDIKPNIAAAHAQ
ncbi:Zinc finger protein 592 [Amphibalanus amphitrite]|uniref:Zinc finger protein 592 n=1 Tax=Amphibalanus amphitrite TaxID=1232801 RepID=A0A6A4XHK5_AMPAM|nr:zinc finger protein 592-like [Amphibalanus amphitrite]KAF0314462.1 Zinc finger protein 592 [Amphibalanus amphitrite]